tara:strand:+ start:5375 stop:5581 length:207 start_codon:yes stop_codon:yes gene_type:complete
MNGINQKMFGIPLIVVSIAVNGYFRASFWVIGIVVFLKSHLNNLFGQLPSKNVNSIIGIMIVIAINII